jgi:hypothetical protein
MKTIRLTCQNDETGGLLAHLKGKVFHLTTLSAFTAIRKTGKILHNKDCRFELNTGSENSFGRSMGYVYLFDLQNYSAEVIESILDNYYFLDPHWFAKTKRGWVVSQLAYSLLDPAYYKRIILNSTQNDHCKATGKFLQYIPHGEVWIDNHVPLDWIETVLLANIRRPAPARNTLAGILRRIEREHR